jgi:DNA repair protein SbcC/Rad50
VRPLRLDLHGFTVFREPTTVDFTDADFFALVGPTGSGKSTILDAICFALYGTVPRWNDRRAVANALAPSAAQARVRLVFESGGLRYAATRVVRRDTKGRVSTAQAGLERLPRGFDLSTLDGGAAELGEPLAGTPAEMDQAVLDAIGLPYEQFTSCVVLPQGAFAEFLHAKPAARQQILVNLLGLSVYEQVRDKATALAGTADAELAATDRLLAELSDASDEALGTAAERVEAMRSLATEVSAAVPLLEDAQRDAQAAAAALADLDGELARLGRVRPPAGAADVAGAVAAASDAVAKAADEVSAAEREEERLRAGQAGAGDLAGLHRLLDGLAERERLTAATGELAGAVGVAELEHARAVRALDEAAEAAAGASARFDAAREALEEARAADRAASLRPHLRVGHACPVCEQEVTRLPAMPEVPAMRAAQAALAQAQDAVEATAKARSAREHAVRDLDRTLSRARAERDARAAQLSTLDTRLTGVVEEEVRAALDAAARLGRELDAAAARVRAARDAHRRATAQAVKARDRLAAQWKEFDAVRDGVARLGPPPADREDLAAAWRALAEWSAAETRRRGADRLKLAGAVDDAQAAARAVAARIDALFSAAGLPAPAGGTGPVEAAAVAVARAESARARLEERRAQADRLRERRATHERDGQVARALAGHLRANNFERWLLEEALDLLVDGGSRILRELSGGQYDLVHDKGEFFVVDQHDAGLRRPVRTLSGGETFQASLALALALSEQLSGMSTGAVSLESIVLDEGFGTLDASTLDTVAATLENLAARGDRTVGVVTHVVPLAERVPVRFEVRKDARGARVERTGA